MCFFFCSRQWRHVGQALHPDRQPREHWVSVPSEHVNIPWVCTQGLCSVSSGECALLLWQREHQLVSLFTSPESPERLSHVWHRKIKLVCAAPCWEMWPASASSQQAGQETFERDRGAVPLRSRLPLRHGRQRLHPADPYPRQQSWPGHRQERRDHQTAAGLRCDRIYCQSHHIFLNVIVNTVDVLQS